MKNCNYSICFLAKHGLGFSESAFWNWWMQLIKEVGARRLSPVGSTGDGRVRERKAAASVLLHSCI